jgi:OmpA-OmpF porin, OOP family
VFYKKETTFVHNITHCKINLIKMKHLNKLFAGAFLLAGLSATAQDSTNPWAISFGANGVDTKISMLGKNDNLLFEELYNVAGHWNIVPSVSYINVAKHIGGNFSFGVTGSFNKISKVVILPNNGLTAGNFGTAQHINVNPGDLTYYGIDGAISYSFQKALKSKWFDPSLNLGGGYTFLGDASSGNVNGGFGLNLWFTENVALTAGSMIKYSFDDTRDANVDVPTHMFHQLGLKFKFGAQDRDDDGIIDKEDACPDVKGLAQFKGCPDTDLDGIQDSEDACINEVGTVEMKGCPDSDGDGISDSEDACPSEAGTKMLNGCPDSDGDGVADKMDDCPTVKGDKANKGCPWPDTDGDGVLDKDDKCKTERGPASNNGCPEKVADASTVQKLNEYAKEILFDTSKSTFQQQTYAVLESMLGILKEYPTSKFALEGHTDSDGKDASNLTLSKDRAAAVKNWLVEKGIASDRLSSEGFGETKPKVKNNTKANKALNRRVEVKLAN